MLSVSTASGRPFAAKCCANGDDRGRISEVVIMIRDHSSESGMWRGYPMYRSEMWKLLGDFLTDAREAELLGFVQLATAHSCISRIGLFEQISASRTSSPVRVFRVAADSTQTCKCTRPNARCHVPSRRVSTVCFTMKHRLRKALEVKLAPGRAKL